MLATNEVPSMPEPESEELLSSDAEPESTRDPRTYREIVWILASGTILVYLLALPVRIQYWRVNLVEQTFRELRRWMLIRDIWWFQLRNLPSFGSELLVQILFAVSALVVLIGVILGLTLILLQDDDSYPAELVNAG